MSIYKIVHTIPRANEADHYLKSNLRQMIMNGMKKNGLKCNCKFCIEIGKKNIDDLTQILVIKKYKIYDKIEYDLIIEAHDMNNYQKCVYVMNIIYNSIDWFFTGKLNYWSGNRHLYLGSYGFLKLSLNNYNESKFNIYNCGIILEVNIFDSSLGIANYSFGNESCDFAIMLINKAEEISSMHGYSTLIVCTNDITSKYYKNKCHYTFTKSINGMMETDLTLYNYDIAYRIYVICIISVLVCIYYIFL